MNAMVSVRRLAVNGIAVAAKASGLLRTLRARRIRSGEYRVFVFEYHEVSSGPESEGIVSSKRLRRHLEYLQMFYEIVPLSEAIHRLGNPQTLSRDLLVVTFDDGCVGNYDHALPVLRGFGASATVFVTTGFIDGHDLWFDFARQTLCTVRESLTALGSESRERLSRILGHWPPSPSLESEVRLLKYSSPSDRETALEILAGVRPKTPAALRPLSWDQIRELHASGVEIGCHTVSHPILSTLSRSEQESEIRQSRQRIEEELGEAPDLFAFPNGSRRDYDLDTLEILRSEGFKAACTTIRGPNIPGCDPLQLKRIGVGADSCMLLEARLSGLFDDWLRRRLS